MVWNVAVASSDIAWGTPVNEETLSGWCRIRKEGLPVGHFTDRELLNGRVILANLKKNEAILDSKLAPIDIKTGGVVAVMDPNKRAMAVKVNEIVGLAWFCAAGRSRRCDGHL